MVKKILGFIMTAALAMSFAATSVFADGNVTISAGQATAKAGEQVTIDVSISNNVGVNNLGFIIKYDSDALTLDTTAAGTIMATNASFDTNIVGEVYFSTYNTTDVSDNGTLCTLTFTVNADASAKAYTVELIDDSEGLGGVWNVAGSLLDTDYVNGTITVEADELPLPTPVYTYPTEDEENATVVGDKMTKSAIITVPYSNETKVATQCTVTVKAPGSIKQEWSHTFAFPTNILNGNVNVAVNVYNVPVDVADQVAFSATVAE